MKKLILIIIIVLLGFPLNAQFEKHDISASYGVITLDQIVDLFENIFVTIFTLGYLEKGDYDYSGALFLTYKYANTDRLNLGLTAGLDRVQGTLLENDQELGFGYKGILNFGASYKF